MIDSLVSWTALPNLHPALVHYPIALVTLGFALDAFATMRRSVPGLDGFSAAVWGLAAAGAGATYLAGQRAADGLARLPVGGCRTKRANSSRIPRADT